MSSVKTPIRRKLMQMILLTSGVVLLLTSVSFFVHEYLTFRDSTVRSLTTLGRVVASNSTAALAFANPDDAREILTALRADPNVVAAGLYDMNGALFAKYPDNLDAAAFPQQLDRDGYRFARSHLVGFQPVVQGERRMGTLYLKSDMAAFYEWLRVYSAIAVLVIMASLLVAYVISRRLQRQISEPILALANTAQAVSDRRDYSVRAAHSESQELGVLTDAFNHMLTQIQGQHLVLRESALRVRAVLDSALSAVIVIDAQGKIVDWNERAETMFGWSRAEAIGRELHTTIIPPQHVEAHRRGLERYLKDHIGPVINRLVEMSALRRDGSEFPVELSISPMQSGDSTTFCGFVTDITARKEADSKLRAQLNRLRLLQDITHAIGARQDLASIFQVLLQNLESHLPIDFGCMCLYDAGNAILTVETVGAGSRGLAADLGLTEQSRLPIDSNGLSHCIGGQLVYEPDVRGVRVAFPERLARAGLRSLVIAPLIVENRVFGVLIAACRRERAFESADCEFLRHLSEHVALAAHQAQLYGALQQAYDDLRQTQHTVMQQERLRALGQMASGIAHDINNAISPVALYTESLLEREPNLSERARGYLVTIQRAIDDVAGTVSRMREFYRQREPQLVLARVNVNRIVEQVIDLTRARWSDLPQQRGIVVELHAEAAESVPDIMGAEGEIRDALTNLIFNAVDAMPEGGMLTVRTHATSVEEGSGEDRAQQVYIEVSDTGVGMDEDTRRRCLEPFFTTKGERGTGLGLAMVYGMIQRHSAELEIESEVDKGTTFRLVFPAYTEAFTSTVRILPQAIAQRLRILLIDDDPMLIKSLQDTLEADGHMITAANGGQVGIDAFSAALAQKGPGFDIVITDLGMPYVDGRKVAAAIKAVSARTPVIMLTGWGQRLIAENDIPPHVNRVLNKPPRLHELRAALAELTAVPA